MVDEIAREKVGQLWLLLKAHTIRLWRHVQADFNLGNILKNTGEKEKQT